MTAQTPPSFLQAGSHPAEDVRRMIDALFGARGGIVAAGDLAVSQNTTPNMSVLVAGGRIAIPGTEATYQGVYFAENRGNTNVAIAAADSTNPRRDLIVARVRDAAYSGATNSFAIEVVTGTPAASPVDPATPANSWVLARVQIAAGATSVTNAAITDLRTVQTGQFGAAVALGGTIPTTSSFRPPSPVDGMRIWETDTKQELVYNAAAVAWVPVSQTSQWTAYTPTLTQSGAVNKSVTYARYLKLGRFVHVQLLLAVTAAGTAANPVTVSLPFNAAQAGNISAGTGGIFDASVPTTYPGRVVINGATTAALSPSYQIGGGFLGSTGFTAALANGDSVDMEFRYEATS